MDLRDELQREKVADLGFRDLVSVTIEASVAEAIEVMRTHEVGCCCVLEGGRLAGIFTERNAVVRVLAAGLDLDTPVSECMTRDPVVCRAADPLHEVLTKLHRGGFRHIPVVADDQRALGTVSVKRALRFLGDHLPEMVYNVAPEPGRFPDRPEGG